MKEFCNVAVWAPSCSPMMKGGRGHSTSQEYVELLLGNGLSFSDISSSLKAQGYSKSRISQLLSAAKSRASPGEEGGDAPGQEAAPEQAPAGQPPAAAAAGEKKKKSKHKTNIK